MLGVFRVPRCLNRLFSDRTGGVLTYTALLVPVLVGAVGLSVDVASWDASHKVLRSSADAAAISGALELLRTGASNIDSAAISAAERNGYKNGKDTIVINHPPLSGSRKGATDSVEVIITRKAPAFFSSIIRPGPQTIVARAVAFGSANDTCVWSLNPNKSGAVTVNGSANVNLDCGMFVNSNNPQALNQTGSSCLTATEAKVNGGYDGTCINPTPNTSVPQIQDPLAWVQAPTWSSCDVNKKTNVVAGQTVTLDPGVYCGDISVQGGATLNFNPGLYILNGAGLNIASSATVNGTGVNFYITQFNGTSDGVSIAGGANVNLTAGNNDPIAGILFYADRNSPTNIPVSFSGGANMHLDGILYFPNQNVSFSGGSSLAATATIIISDTVTFTGNTEVGLSGSVISANPLLISAKLAE